MRTLIASISVTLLLTVGAGASSAAGPRTVTGVVGPAFNISLKLNGKNVKLLPPARYVFVIRDNSNIHNFHLTGPGVNKKTSVAAKGTSTWRVTLRRGTYRFVCDPHPTTMRGRFAVQAS